jgi:YidC/Oxa1 family membrane protein insertase
VDFLLPVWNPFIVHPMENGLRLIAQPLASVLSPGVAGALAIIIFTILLRLVLLPLSLMQIRSQKHQLAIQPELKALQKKFKGDREGMARAQMALYKERGVNPTAGCVPLLIQLPILFGMYAAMSQLSTLGLTLDQVSQRQLQPGQVVYAAERHSEPLPFNQFLLATLKVVPQGNNPVTVDVPLDQASVQHSGVELGRATQGLTLMPGTAPGNTNPPNTPGGTAAIFLRGGVPNGDGTMNRNALVEPGQPYQVEIWVDASSTNADTARATLTYDPSLLQVSDIVTPTLTDVPFKSRFLWLPSLGEPDVLGRVNGISIPGLLLIIMTVTSFISQRMTTLPTEDPQQQAMMRSMAFMPLMYLFFFLNTPAGLVLYWLVSNVFSMFQQYFTVGLGLLGGDLQRYTGRDFQPPWAHLPGPKLPLGNGRADGVDTEDEQTTPAAGVREASQSGAARGAGRRPRPGPGKGRRRGKR